MMKILSRYVLSAAAIALVLLMINFTALTAWFIQTGSSSRRDMRISRTAGGLTLSDGEFVLSEPAQKQLDQNHQWAMLLNHNGTVVWSHNLPSDVPSQYTVSDVAGFSRWYLNDYPVYVWRHTDGLFVLGNPKYSMWKHDMELSQKGMENLRFWLPLILIINGVTAILLALLFGLRLFHSLKRLSDGIEGLAQKRPVELPPNGILGDLALGINQASARLAKQEAALHKRDNARTTWIAGISHDIRTPLSLAMGYAGQLEEDLSLPPARRNQALIIRRQCEQIKTLVNDLNLASKLEYDMQPLRKERVALAPLLRSVVTSILNSGIPDIYTLNVSVRENAQNSFAHADSGLLKRALCNLINNSINHNPEGCDIQIALSQNTKSCIFTIADNGAGFPAETLDRLNHEKEPMELKNHGLGLTIVRQIVKAHDGSIEFHNLTEGGGSVIFYLPIEPLSYNA